MVMQRPAKPFTPVRFRLQPPFMISIFFEGSLQRKIKYNLQITHARVVELVDTRDLKSLASNGVPVQVRLRVPTVHI